MNNRLMKFDSRKSFLPSILNDDFFTNFFEGNSLPAANIVENKDEFRVELLVPGFNKDEFNIEVEKNVLIISAKQESKKEERLIREKFRSSSFSRSFVLPDSVDMEKISAQHNDGLLKLSIPKLNQAPEDKIKRIEIK